MRKLLFWGVFFSVLSLQAQKSKKIELASSSTDLFVGDEFVLEATVTNIRSNIQPNFPRINGFKKTSLSVPFRQSSIVNGRYSGIIKYQQRYQALHKGTYYVKPFTIKMDGISTSVRGFKLTVKGLPEGKGASYFLLETSKDEVFVGEPFKLSLSFVYMKEEAQFISHTRDKEVQIDAFKSKLLTPSLWVEEISGRNNLKRIRTPSGQEMIKEVLYQVVLVPQASTDLIFDSLTIVMKKATESSRGGYKMVNTTYSSNSKKVIVMELPEHPLKGKVPVGNYKLREGIEKLDLLEGENVVYTFEVSGAGNLATLLDPQVIKSDTFLVFKEADQLEYSNDTGRVEGRKIYMYNLVPDKAGIYEVKDYVFFPFFNSETGTYDTLKSKVELKVNRDETREVIGNSQSEWSGAKDDTKFHSTTSNNKLVSIDQSEKQNFVIILLLLLFITGLVFMLVKRREV